MTTAQEKIPAGGKIVIAVLAVWLIAALLLGFSGKFHLTPPPLIAATNWGLVLVTLIALWRIPPLRYWALTVDLRLLVLYHLVRFVGIYFLILQAQGRLPAEFATRAGWGDIIVSVTAIMIVFGCLPMRTQAHWRRVLLWNILGLADILLVIYTGIRLALANLTSMAEITKLPLSLLPTMIVPLIIVTHVLIFVRLWRERETASPLPNNPIT